MRWLGGGAGFGHGLFPRRVFGATELVIPLQSFLSGAPTLSARERRAQLRCGSLFVIIIMIFLNKFSAILTKRYLQASAQPLRPLADSVGDRADVIRPYRVSQRKLEYCRNKNSA